MKKFLLGFVIGIVMAILVAVIFIGTVAALRDSKPTVADASTLIYRLEGEIPEASPVEFPFFDSNSSLTVLDHYRSLRQAATDSRIKAVVFEPYAVSAGWGKLQEIREGLLAFKKSGKPLIAYLRSPTTREYYLATAADKIYMNREDYLNVKGLRAEVMFYKNTLDKLGVQVEAERVGRYKDAPDMFVRTSLTPDSRAVLDTVLDSLYGDLISTIAQGRKKTPEQIRALMDNGPFLADKAVSDGLLDGILFEDEVFGQLQKQFNQKELKKTTIKDFARALPSGSGKRIAIISGDGDITRGTPGDGVQNDNGITAFGFNKVLRRVANDKNISAVVLRINSPGGDAIASDEILREIKLLSKQKPLIISMSDVAASGGYYMAVPGDPVLAYPGTLTGSIGIYFIKPNLRGLLDKVGITEETLQRGKNASIDSLTEPLNDTSRAKLREGLENFYQNFVKVVADGRRRKYEEIEPLAQGRVWLGSQAKQNGLVDELGGLDRALELVKAKAKIDPKEKVQLVAYPQKRTLVEQLLSLNTDASVEASVPRELKPFTRQMINLDLLRKGGMMSYMPWRVEIK